MDFCHHKNILELCRLSSAALHLYFFLQPADSIKVYLSENLKNLIHFFAYRMSPKIVRRLIKYSKIATKIYSQLDKPVPKTLNSFLTQEYWKYAKNSRSYEHANFVGKQ